MNVTKFYRCSGFTDARFLLFWIFFLGAFSLQAAQLAFPGAEGFGRFATGGRGGTVYHVTNLNNAGVGSFRDAVSQPNRIVVFDVGGIIKLDTALAAIPQIASNITIAGQTAPGDGICIYGNGVGMSGGKNVIIRHIRFRMGVHGRNAGDAFGFASGKNIILDHVSISWGRDGTLDMNRYASETLDSITIQNCILSHGLQPHSTGGLQQTNGYISVLRTLFINNWTRNPKQTCNHQFINNVVYNFGASCYNFGGGATFSTYSNLTNNYFICGSGSQRDGITEVTGALSNVYAFFYGNYCDKNRDGILNGDLITTDAFTLNVQAKPNVYPSIAKEMSAVDAYKNIISDAGASFHRDQVDSNLMVDLQSLGKQGIFITDEAQLPTKGPGIIRGGKAPTDSDLDGMPNEWETYYGLNPIYSGDGKLDFNKDGYTNVEDYINSIVSGVRPKIKLTVTAVDTAKVLGTPNPEFKLLYSGFVGKDNLDSLNTLPVATCVADTASALGEYTIEVKGGADDKYDFTYTSGVLKVLLTTSASTMKKNTCRILQNPVVDNLILNIDSYHPGAFMEIYNQHGIKLKTVQIYCSTTVLDMTQYASGMYLVKIHNDKEVTENKIIKI